MRAPDGDDRRAAPQQTPLRIALALAVVASFGLGVWWLRSGAETRRATPVRPAVPAHATGEPHDPVPVPVPPVEDTRRLPSPPDVLTDVEPDPALITGWRVAGRVHARGGKAVGGARVRVEMEIGGETRPLGETLSRTDGSYALGAPVLGELDALSASLCQVRATADAAHHALARAQARFRADVPDQAVRIDLRLDAGERLVGRIVDALRQQPVARALVRFSVAGVHNGITTFSPLQEVETDESGRFDFGFMSSGRYRLSARADGVGCASVEALDLEAGQSRDLGDVRLAGGEPIAGTVTHPGGEPAAHFELWAFDGDYANQPDALALAVRKAADVERSDGLAYTRTRTDAQGQFALRGLRPGHYALRSPDPRAALEPHQLRFEPGTAGVKLELLSYSLVVRVRDENGLPVRGANVCLTDLSTEMDGSHKPSGGRTVTAQGSEAVATFCVDPAAPYALEAYTSKRRSAEEVVMLAQNEFVREVQVVLPRKPAEGRIHLDVQGEDGQPLVELQVQLLASVTQARREDVGLIETDHDGVTPPIPCGTYHLVVGYLPGTDRDHLPVRTTAPVTVVHEAPVRVSLRPRRGGRVTVSLVLEGPAPAGFVDEPPTGSSAAQRAAFEEDKRSRFGVSVLALLGGENRFLQFQRAGQSRLESRLLPGESATTREVLEPGAYWLSLSSPPGPWEAARQMVSIVPGEIAVTSFTVRAR